jgi:HSP20 family protein
MSNWLERMKQVWPWSSGNPDHEQSVQTDALGPERLEDRQLATPPVDIFENDEELLLLADVPGAHVGNTQIFWDVQRGLQLYVRRGPAARESSSGNGSQPDWFRAFRLPDYLDAPEARSSVRDGVLRIRIPRKPRSNPVTIAVESHG